MLVIVLLGLFSLSSAASTCGQHNESFGPNCVCYNTTNMLVCTNLNQTLTLQNAYHFDKLIAKNSKVALFSATTLDNLTIGELVIEQREKVESDDYVKLISVTQKKLDFKSDFTLVVNLVEANFTWMQSIVFEKLALLTNLSAVELVEAPHLKHCALKHIVSVESSIQDGVLSFDNATLDYLELSNTTFDDQSEKNLVISMSPASCPNNTIINLRNLDQLSIFNFTNLASNCTYHLDTSQDQNLQKDMLTTQVHFLQTLNTSQLFWVSRQTILDCDCSVYKWYQDRKSFIHGVVCLVNNVQIQLDNLKFSDVC